MLTDGQKKYLANLDPVRAISPVTIKPYSALIAATAQSVIDKIKKEIPEVDIKFMGASALGISGQNDVDIYIFSSDQSGKYTNCLTRLFGKQSKKNKWHWYENNIEVSVYISDPENYKTKEQIEIFNIFKS